MGRHGEEQRQQQRYAVLGEACDLFRSNSISGRDDRHHIPTANAGLQTSVFLGIYRTLNTDKHFNSTGLNEPLLRAFAGRGVRVGEPAILRAEEARLPPARCFPYLPRLGRRIVSRASVPPRLHQYPNTRYQCPRRAKDKREFRAIRSVPRGSQAVSPLLARRRLTGRQYPCVGLGADKRGGGYRKIY
jgi:hypothetical protein